MNFIEALLLGISTGPFCFGYCAPILIPFLTSEHQKVLQLGKRIFFFLAGRLSGYLLIGFISGIIGLSIKQVDMQLISSIASLLMGVILIIFGIIKNFPKFKICKILQIEKSSFVFICVLGLLTGVNLCPPFIAAITGAISTKTMIGSLVYFLLFFLGTSIFFIPMFLTGIISRFKKIRIIARICIILTGGWLVVKGILAFSL